MMSKYLVTGGCGFIGSHLVDKLIEDGNEVVVYDVVKRNLNPKARYYQIEVESVNASYHLNDGYEAIFHLAAESRIQPSFKNPYLTHQSNVSGTASMLELARACKAKFVFASSSSVHYDMYANPYAFSKQIGESYCILWNKLYGVPTSIARFYNVYGPRQIEEGPYATVVGIFMNRKKRNLPLQITGDGSQRRDFVHVDDIVSGLIESSKQNWDSNIFELGTGTSYSIMEVAQMFKQSIEYIDRPPGEAAETKAVLHDTRIMLGWKAKKSLPDYIKQELDAQTHN